MKGKDKKDAGCQNGPGFTIDCIKCGTNILVKTGAGKNGIKTWTVPDSEQCLRIYARYTQLDKSGDPINEIFIRIDCPVCGNTASIRM